MEFSPPCLGDPSVFVRLIHDGHLRLDHVEDHTEDELRGILDRCGESIPSAATKVGVREKACGCVFMTRIKTSRL